MPNLSVRFAALLIPFAPLLVYRSWLHVQVALIGAILASGRRTVASVLRIIEGLNTPTAGSVLIPEFRDRRPIRVCLVRKCTKVGFKVTEAR